MDRITIVYLERKGRMTILLDRFFPTDSARVRKLLKTINADYEHRDELRETVVRHCRERAQKLMDSRRELANRLVNYRTEAEELQPRIDRLSDQTEMLQQYVATFCKQGSCYHRQLKTLEAELKGLKDRQRSLFSMAEDCRRQFNRAGKEAERLLKNVEVIAHERK